MGLRLILSKEAPKTDPISFLRHQTEQFAL
jgi:hypothetical protein